MLDAADVGHRVVVRRVVGTRAGRPLYRDVLGELAQLGEQELTVRTDDGADQVITRAEVAAAKRIPPRPAPRRRPPRS